MKNDSILNNGADLVEIFIKHPVRQFPVLKKNKIIGYISKTRVIRFSTDQNFLDKKTKDILSLLIENIDHDSFFQNMEQQAIKAIPYLSWVSNRLEIHKKNKKDFFLKHRPVKNITTDDLSSMVIGHYFPIVVFDGSGNLLMENYAAKKIRILTGMQNSVNPFLHWIKKEDLKLDQSKKSKTGIKTHSGYKCVYHVQNFQLKKGVVTLAILLNFQKRKT